MTPNYPRGRTRIAQTAPPPPIQDIPAGTEDLELVAPEDKRVRAKSLRIEQAEQVTYFDQVRACCSLVRLGGGEYVWVARPDRPGADCILSVANESAAGGTIGAVRWKMGVIPGVPDVGVFAPGALRGERFPGLFIEFKRPDGVPSDVRQAQHAWHDRLHAGGFLVVVSYGWRRAWDITREYLGWEE